jgi:hypothetical protein
MSSRTLEAWLLPSLYLIQAIYVPSQEGKRVALTRSATLIILSLVDESQEYTMGDKKKVPSLNSYIYIYNLFSR